MESPKREIDLRPISRDLIRVRSEDLGFDPIKDRQQFQEKKDRCTEQQAQLQHHQRQWRLQKRKLHRRLLRKKQRLAEKQLSHYKLDEAGAPCQYKRREAWIHGQINTISDNEEDIKSALMHMVEAPLEAHFLKGAERRREMKGEESDSLTEMSSTDDWDDSDLGADNDETFHMPKGKAGKSASFSTNLRHRLQCARCHIYYHYYHHGHCLANVHPHQPASSASSQQSKRDARSLSVAVCSPCDYDTSSCLGSEQRPSWNRLRPSFAYESTISSQKHGIPATELQRSSSERCVSPPTLSYQFSNESRRSGTRRLFSEDSCNSDSEVTRRKAAVKLRHKQSISKPSVDDNSESEYSTCDLGLYEDRYSFNYSGSFGGGNNYYVLVVVDDADASTDPGSENDDVAAGIAHGRVRGESVV